MLRPSALCTVLHEQQPLKLLGHGLSNCGRRACYVCRASEQLRWTAGYFAIRIQLDKRGGSPSPFVRSCCKNLLGTEDTLRYA